MTITYELENALYLNITNRCTNNCSFCVRNSQEGLSQGVNLWLKREPTVEEVVTDIQKWDIDRYQEFVFCGYGEPMIRTYDIIEICTRLKTAYSLPIRINTNGHANLICGRDITPQLTGVVDAVSISMNAKNSKEYQQLCRSQYGERAYAAMLDFATKCKKHIPRVRLSIVDVMAKDDIQACRKIAGEIGVDLKVRHFVNHN
ncbi:TatD family nuclease-associated radical SAM protein [Sporomusa sp. KB1]|jgi:radical SAM enzyme (TIGR04100 family)|uniref:TatD family nuclease-associated radical SAM protein n=1 Tax=Sporomusa sp. KB1 TaxID=943346 RepID=UPI0011A1E724|nr:TatD family nuclease-associated radical SAM protein [Sporomusa sp. KB1]TWH47628.1 radical SAM enzyme (TIGR04100 family) [Sporomusa sp. KB1]